MFKRREKLPLRIQVGRWLWPRMGWRRLVVYYWHRLQRIPGTPASIAAGFACGVGISMTPFYGTHVVTAALMAWAIRGSIVAAVIGAQAANPWTAAPLWFAAYYLGAFLLGMNLADNPPNFIQMFKWLTEAMLQVDMDMFMTHVWPIFWPMIVGSIPMAVVAGLVSYFALTPILTGVHERRIARRRHNRELAHADIPPAGADV
ncbi:MAG: DUF2062 domain-containing protein [Rhodospirillaceae bacterium]|nr:DUF2062 domain-containing protein [Rhodospirillaceae bacterium]